MIRRYFPQRCEKYLYADATGPLPKYLPRTEVNHD